MLQRSSCFRHEVWFCALGALMLGAGCAGTIVGGDGSGGAGGATSDVSESRSSSTPMPDGGKFHPTTNGIHETEAAACAALSAGWSAALLHLQCVGTSRICPDLLRAEFVTPCLEYDQGSVQGCLAYYNQATTCDELRKAFDSCAVTAFPGTVSAGCTM